MTGTNWMRGVVLVATAAFGMSTVAVWAAAIETVRGTPELKSIQAISFGADGTLLIGDAAGSQIVAVLTGDTSNRGRLNHKIENIQGKLAAGLGTTADGLELIDMAVNPASGMAYFAVRRQDNKQYALLTVDAEGRLGEFSLEGVDYAAIRLPQGDQKPVDRITDVTFADDRIVAAAAANEEFGSKIFVIESPIKHNGEGLLHSAETFHVAHNKWETKAPMTTVMPYHEGGKTYVVGAFACTPVVKYALDDLQPAARVKGTSVVELGSGNRPLDMFIYEKDGKEYVLANTFRFHHDRRPVGPSPYWTVRFGVDLLAEYDAVNESAIRRVDRNFTPTTDRIMVVEAFHGVMLMDKLDPYRALVVRKTESGRLDLEPLPLP